MLQRFKQQRIIITGGASGLGQALIMKFARLGWKIAIVDMNRDSAEKVATQARSQGATETKTFFCDIAEDKDFADIAQALKSDWDGVDIIINNAGVGSCGWLEEVDTCEWQRVMNLNLNGTFRGCHFWRPLLPEGEPAHIVNTSSFAGIAHAAGMLTYNVSKAAVIALSESLRVELGSRNCGVSVVCPAFFKTSLLDSMHNASSEMQSLVHHLMEVASVTAGDVADDILAAIEHNRFMVITHDQARKAYWLKRFMPELFFRKGLQRAAGLIAKGQVKTLKTPSMR